MSDAPIRCARIRLGRARGDAAGGSPAAMPPSAASGWSGSARSCCRPRLPRLPARSPWCRTAPAASPRPRSGSRSTSRGRPVPRSGHAARDGAKAALAGADWRASSPRRPRRNTAPGRRLFSDGLARGARRDRGRSVPPRPHGRFWLPASTESTSPPRATAMPTPSGLRRARGRDAARTRFNADFLTVGRRHRSGRGRHLGRLQGLAPDDAGHARPRLPDRRPLGRLSRGICAAEPLDRPHRGLDQQSRRGALDHLRAARPRRLPQLHAHAALGADRRRADAGADDHAGHRHRRAQRDQVGAALDPRRRSGRRREPDPGRLPPRPAAGPARHPDRDDHRHGPRARRDGAAC